MLQVSRISRKGESVEQIFCFVFGGKPDIFNQMMEWLSLTVANEDVQQQLLKLDILQSRFQFKLHLGFFKELVHECCGTLILIF